MEEIIFFNQDNGTSVCRDQVYFEFLDYAFSKTDYFMLVYVNYYGKGYKKNQKEIKNKLEPYRVKTRTNPSWPGTPETYSLNTTYKVIFYKNHPDALEILKSVSCIDAWSRPSNPEDLAFFKGNQCWFYSVGHEALAAIIHATKEDIEFVKTHNLSSKNNVLKYDHYYDSYDENIDQT